MSIRMDADGTCRKTRDETIPPPVCSQRVGDVAFRLHAALATDAETLLQLPLPLPFGSNLVRAPVWWTWDKPCAPKISDLDDFLTKIHFQTRTQQGKRVAREEHHELYDDEKDSLWGSDEEEETELEVASDDEEEESESEDVDDDAVV